MLRSLGIAMALCVAAAVTAAAGEPRQLDGKGRFRDAHFGARVESFTGMEQIGGGSLEGMKTYVRPADDLKIGDAKLDGISYVFYEDRLYFVALFTSGSENAAAMLRELKDAYGKGTMLSRAGNEFVWTGKRVFVHFLEDLAAGTSMVGLTSAEIDARRKGRGGAVPVRAAR